MPTPSSDRGTAATATKSRGGNDDQVLPGKDDGDAGAPWLGELKRGALVRVLGLSAAEEEDETVDDDGDDDQQQQQFGSVVELDASTGLYQVELHPEARSTARHTDSGGARSAPTVVRVPPEGLEPVSFEECMLAQGYQVATVSPFDRDPPVFGGGAPTEWHLDFLPRAAQLPRLGEEDVRFNYPDDGDDDDGPDAAGWCVRAFQDLHRGRFAVAWRGRRGVAAVDDDAGEISALDVTEVQFALAPGGGAGEGAAAAGPGRSVPLVVAAVTARSGVSLGLAGRRRGAGGALDRVSGSGSRLVDGAGWTNVTTALAGDGTRVEARYAPNRLLPKFATLVSNEAMEALAFRLLHHFLRHCGASLDAAASRYVLESVLQWFGNAENGDHLEEFLDLTVVRMDLLASVEKKRDCVVLPRVGEALEALGRFPLAARVYRHAADHYPAGPEGGEMRWRVYEYAGIAYRRHDRLELAEDMYARALHLYERGGNPFDFGDENFEKLCHNIKIMYGPLGVRSVENKKVMVTFDFLLAAAGYFEAVGHPFWAPSTDYVLKPEFRLRSGALRALRSAARAAATAAEFRAGVLGCAKRGVNWSAFAVAGVPGRSEESLVRECSLDVLSRGNASKSLVRCFNPACAKLEENNEGGKFMQCPCRTTYYCSKACQAAHWKVHKKSCPWKCNQNSA